MAKHQVHFQKMKDELSLDGFAHALVKEASEIMRTAKTEEDLRIGFEKALTPVLKAIGITGSKYERHSGKTASEYKGRPDAIHGKVIIEYESPRSLTKKGQLEHAEGQLHDYLSAEGYAKGEAAISLFERPLGVGFDGEQIFFVRFGEETKKKADVFEREGPYDFDVESARTFLMHLRGLSRKPLTPENLAEVFGPESALAPTVVTAFANALEHWGTGRPRVFFNEWKRLFGIVYGAQFDARKEDEAKALSKHFGVGKDTDFQELLFSVHTYFAYLMKLIAVEILNISDIAFKESFCAKLTHLKTDEFKAALEDIENGGVYARRGISNFLEGDFFRWYLDAMSPELQDALREIARELSQFEPATTTLHPRAARDLLKKLYQYLVPQPIRHKLGEYYTPDWLAELVIEEAGYSGKLEHRALDPACGSGTFLVLAIQRAKKWAKEKKVPDSETAKYILQNIWGFDLNPLAVIASRTNYLFALGDLVSAQKHIEIPVYLADSVLSPVHEAVQNTIFGKCYEMKTSVKEFHIPAGWVQMNSDLKAFQMERAALIVEELVKRQEDVPGAMKRLTQEGLALKGDEQAVEQFYTEILDLEKEGKNGIWARFLKNAFAPTVAGRFDFVIGNPPWIRWGYLAEEYRAATLNLWKEYGLFSLKGHAARLGGGEKDFSMLFVYAATDRFLKKGGVLGFLITQELFKSKGAGEGFRRFRLGEREDFQVTKAHDLVQVQPFEGAANKTAAIFLKRGKKTEYPIPYIVWQRKKGVGSIPTDAPYENAKQMLSKKKFEAKPIGKDPVSAWQTTEVGHEDIAGIQGENPYQARLGARVEPYGIFWIEIKEVLSDGNLLVANQSQRGKRKMKLVETDIENELVFPAVAGRDVHRWGAKPGTYILMSQDPKESEPYPEAVMKKDWPRTYDYFSKFKDELLSRGSKTVRQFAEKTAFYAMFGIGPYTIAPYKVVWKRMTNDMHAAVISQWKTPYGWKQIIPTDTTSLFALENEDEAHYICAILNSQSVRDFIKSYSSAGRGFGSPSVMKHLGIPKFDPRNALHVKLEKLSKDLHELVARQGDASGISTREGEVNACMKQLFS